MPSATTAVRTIRKNLNDILRELLQGRQRFPLSIFSKSPANHLQQCRCSRSMMVNKRRIEPKKKERKKERKEKRERGCIYSSIDPPSLAASGMVGCAA